MSYNIGKLKIDFSLRREVFFVVLGALLGAIMMMLPGILYDLIYGYGNYYLIWIIFGHVIGVYSNYTILAGIAIHFITALFIGIVLGLFLYKTGILEINKPLNVLFYGLFTGAVVFFLWTIPVQHLILNHQTVKTIALMYQSLSEQTISNNLQKDLILALIQNCTRNLIFGITLGLTTSFLSIKLGKRFRCPKCNVSFSKVEIIKKHLYKIHNKKVNPKKVVILGGGFSGVEALKKLQKAFEDDVDVDITLINKDNFLLFTPMLHEVVSGMIETSHIAIPLRSFCKRARFIEADVELIDIEKRKIFLKSSLPLSSDNYLDKDLFHHFQIEFDYLLVSLGGETNYYNNRKITQSSFSMKTLYDANSIRSHIITTLELADTLDNDKPDEYNRENKDINVILVSSSNGILPEMEESLGRFALEELKKTHVQIILATKVKDIINTSTIQNSNINSGNYLDKSPLGSLFSIKIQDKDPSLIAVLNNSNRISTYTIIWTAGVIPEEIIQKIPFIKDKKGRLINNEYFQVKRLDNVFAEGDCVA